MEKTRRVPNRRFSFAMLLSRMFLTTRTVASLKGIEDYGKIGKGDGDIPLKDISFGQLTS
jgi:hypothetical protein